jgi:sulfate adenylyltransferase
MSEIGHGGKQIVERILDPKTAKEKIQGLKKIPVREQMAVEIIDLAYGFFSPL